MTRNYGPFAPITRAPQNYTGPVSVVQTGMDHNYATDIMEFNTVDEACEYAKSIGGAWVVYGIQMWNEPVGQTEDEDEAYNTWIEGY